MFHSDIIDMNEIDPTLRVKLHVTTNGLSVFVNDFHEEARIFIIIPSDAAIEHAKTSPPRGTRAYGRGGLVKALIECQFENEKPTYIIDWFGFRLDNEEPFLMVDPFLSYKEEIHAYIKDLPSQKPFDREGLYNS